MCLLIYILSYLSVLYTSLYFCTCEPRRRSARVALDVTIARMNIEVELIDKTNIIILIQ